MRYGDVELHNVCDIVETEGQTGFGLSRLPCAILGEINEGARRMSAHGAGCEIRGMLAEGGQARVVLQTMDSNVTPPVATVYHGCFCSQSVLVRHEPTEIIIKAPPLGTAMSHISAEKKLPFDPRLVRVRLPRILTRRSSVLIYSPITAISSRIPRRVLVSARRSERFPVSLRPGR